MKRKEVKSKMFKRVTNCSVLKVGDRFIDTKSHRIIVIEDNYPLIGAIRFVDVDDPDEMFFLSYDEVRERLRHLNVSDLEIRALLCSSMLEFIQYMLFLNSKKGGDDNGSGKRNC